MGFEVEPDEGCRWQEVEEHHGRCTHAHSPHSQVQPRLRGEREAQKNRRRGRAFHFPCQAARDGPHANHAYATLGFMQRARTAARPVAYTHAKSLHRCFFPLSLSLRCFAGTNGRKRDK